MLDFSRGRQRSGVWETALVLHSSRPPATSDGTTSRCCRDPTALRDIHLILSGRKASCSTLGHRENPSFVCYY